MLVVPVHSLVGTGRRRALRGERVEQLATGGQAQRRATGDLPPYRKQLLSGLLLNSHLLPWRHDRLVPTGRSERYDRHGRINARLGLVPMLLGLRLQWRIGLVRAIRPAHDFTLTLA